MIIKLFWTSTSLSVFPFSWRTSAAFSWKSFGELLLIFHQTSARPVTGPVPILLKYIKVPVLLKSTSTCHFQWVPVWSQCLRSSTLRHICRQSGRGTNQYPSLMRALVKLVSWGKLLMVRLTLTQGISETMCLLFNFETNSTPISSIYVMFFTSILKTLDCKSSKSLSYDLFSKLNCSLKIDLFSQNCFVFW